MSSAESGAHCGCRTAFFATDQPTFPLHHLIPQSQAAVVLLFYGMVDADVSGHGWLLRFAEAHRYPGFFCLHFEARPGRRRLDRAARSEEHTSELQSLMRISYAVFCLKKKQTTKRDLLPAIPPHVQTI